MGIRNWLQKRLQKRYQPLTGTCAGNNADGNYDAQNQLGKKLLDGVEG